jgi:hypothetical protein
LGDALTKIGDALTDRRTGTTKALDEAWGDLLNLFRLVLGEGRSH